MSDAGNHGRGRARGRARAAAVVPPAPPRGPGLQSAPPGFAQHAPPPVGGAAGPAWQHARPSEGTSAASSLAGGIGRMELGGTGPDGEGAVGRGAMRGRREITKVSDRTRPEKINSKKGATGTPVKLSANYFKLETHTNWCLYQYHVDFAPEEDHTMIRKGLMRNHKDTLGGYIFDGTVMYTSHRLHPEPMELFSKRSSDDVNVRISLRLVGDVAGGDAHYIQIFNILMRMSLGHLNLQLVGRNFYDALAKVEVQQYRLELWPGYVTSIRQHEKDILMCCEITHKVMRKDNCLQLLKECVQNNRGNYRDAFKAGVIGLVVLTDYNNHTYRVDDVDFNTTAASTFAKRSGEQISYADYYRSKYGINISDRAQPMLVSRAKPKERRAGMAELVYLVPELCRLTGLSDAMRADFHLMRAVADYTRIGPEKRIKNTEKFNERLLGSAPVMNLFKEWNMRLSKSLVQFDGRVLPEQAMTMGKNVKFSSLDKYRQPDWTEHLKSKPMLCVGTLTNWVMIYFTRCSSNAKSFAQSVCDAAHQLSFLMPQPYFHEISDDRSSTYVKALEQVISLKNPQLIMCVVSNNRADRYAAIKKKCCIDRAVPTQVMLAKNIDSKLWSVKSIATKVAIQINCKIGGAPWAVKIPLKGLMVCGFDVCHDTTSKEKSYGALVCSLDDQFTRYFSTVSAHKSGEELSDFLSVNMMKALRTYMDHNQGNLPQKIIMYRDGVGEGQVPYVFAHEVEELKSKLTDVYRGPTWKMAFIIVTKRINTRLFLNNGNPPPGTVVDDYITMPEKYDFYLVSQSVRQGTVSPTSYNIISDNVGLDPDKLQQLTYKLTHLYFNWSGTVRVPAPCQYAHKLAFLVGQSLHRSPSNQLETTLYFL